MDDVPEDNVEDQESERGRYLKNGFRILRTMHRDYKKFHPGETPSWLREEWQDLIEEGKAENKGEYA